jgi:hypothetical protein
MTKEEFTEFRRKLNEECEGLLDCKGSDYTTGNDRLDNFKRVSEVTGVTPLGVWSVYFLKHVLAIMKYVRSHRVESESIRGRFVDVRNYIDLGMAIIDEEISSTPLP